MRCLFLTVHVTWLSRSCQPSLVSSHLSSDSLCLCTLLYHVRKTILMNTYYSSPPLKQDNKRLIISPHNPRMCSEIPCPCRYVRPHPSRIARRHSELRRGAAPRNRLPWSPGWVSLSIFSPNNYFSSIILEILPVRPSEKELLALLVYKWIKIDF